MQPRRRGSGHLGQGRVGNVRSPRQLCGAKVVRLVLKPCDLVRRHAPQDGVRAFRHGLDDDEVAEAFQQVFHEPPGIVARLDDPVYGPEDRCSVRCGHGLHDVVQQ